MGLYPDLLFYYGLDLRDVIRGDGPAPSLVMALIQRLPDDSLTAALANGGVEHFGWGVDRHLFQNLFDALNLNTKATGTWKNGKPPDIPSAFRPTTSRESQSVDAPREKRVRVADLYARFSGGT